MSAPPPPHMPKPNYVNPHLHGSAFLAVGSTLFGIACLFVFARLYARLVIVRRFGADDFFIILALLGRAACYVLSYYMIYHWYMNRHVYDIPPEKFGVTFKGIWESHHVAYATLLCAKVSVLLFYLRVLARVQNKMIKWLIIGTIGFVVAYSIVVWFGYAFNCDPVEANWMQHVPSWAAKNKFTCTDVTVWPMFAAVINCISDFWITALPIAFIGRLNLPLRQRQGLYIVFSLGFFGAAAGAIQAGVIHLMLYKRHVDVTWYFYDVLVWAEVECNLAIICACAPALKAFTSHARLESKPSKYTLSTAFTKDTKAKGSGHGSLPSVNDASRSRDNDSERNLVGEEAKQKGEWSWKSPNGSGITRFDTVELESHAKEDA